MDFPPKRTRGRSYAAPSVRGSVARSLQASEDADTNAKQTGSGEHAKEFVARDQSKHVADESGDGTGSGSDGSQTGSSLGDPLLP